MALPGFETRTVAKVVLAVQMGGFGCSVAPASSPPGAEGGARTPDSDSGKLPPRAAHDAARPPKNDVPDAPTAAPPPPPPRESGAVGPCSAPGLLVCDDFEAMTVGSPPSGYVLESGGGTPGQITITDQTAHGGRHSVYVNGDTFSSLFTKKGAPVFPRTSNSFYVRVWMRASEEFASGHSAFIEAGPDNTNNETEIRVGFHVNQLEVNRMPSDAEQLSNGGNYNDPSTGIHFVKDTWHCLEVLFDGGHDELRVWVEGNEVTELHVTDWKQGVTGWSPNYAAIRFGYEKYSGPSMQVWYDDVAIGTSRIGCE